jgi:hypothetical protein
MLQTTHSKESPRDEQTCLALLFETSSQRTHAFLFAATAPLPTCWHIRFAHPASIML